MTEQSRDPAIDSEIARRAHDIWEKEGRPHGRDQAHWSQAETEVLAGLADHVLPGEVATLGDPVTPDQGVEPSATEPLTKAPARRKPAAKRSAAATKVE